MCVCVLKGACLTVEQLVPERRSINEPNSPTSCERFFAFLLVRTSAAVPPAATGSTEDGGVCLGDPAGAPPTSPTLAPPTQLYLTLSSGSGSLSLSSTFLFTP